jgi:hypothetical protein
VLLSKAQLKAVGLSVLGAGLYAMLSATSYGKTIDSKIKDLGSKV